MALLLLLLLLPEDIVELGAATLRVRQLVLEAPAGIRQSVQ